MVGKGNISNPDYNAFKKELLKLGFKGDLLEKPFDRIVNSINASPYKQIPKMVARVSCEEDIILLMKVALKRGIPYTFKAAGTSLSGQCISKNLLIVLNEKWRNFKFEKDGHHITVQVGLTGLEVNQLLMPYRKKIGPDPSSLSVAKIGGIVANNAKGNCCGSFDDSYSTLKSMKVILYDGTLLDSEDLKSRSDFEKSHDFLLKSLKEISEEAKNNPEVFNLIKHKYKIRNTVGLTLCALLDFEDPIDILIHLMIGSEGTLGFISEVTLKTISIHPFTSTALVTFKNKKDAQIGVKVCKDVGASAVEWMNDELIFKAREVEGLKSITQPIDCGGVTLLIEVNSASESGLRKMEGEINKGLQNIGYDSIETSFKREWKDREKIWSLRKGAFTISSKGKKTSASLITEDVVVPIDSLSKAVEDIENLLLKNNYEKIVFGHALFGNLHLIFSVDFSKEHEKVKYDSFMQDLFSIVIDKYRGSMKGEHGTGRNISPFVEKEWGESCFKIMGKIKKIFDPKNLINNGVIFNDDKKSYLKNISVKEKVDPTIDDCVECGFCEPVCPSRNIALNPRQRIAVLREVVNGESKFSKKELEGIKKEFNKKGINTCGIVGVCGLACPIGIDTGEMIKKIQIKNKSEIEKKIAGYLANNFNLLEGILKSFLILFHFFCRVFKFNNIHYIFKKIRGLGFRSIPFLFSKETFPIPGRLNKYGEEDSCFGDKKVIFFPTCVERMMRHPGKDDNLFDDFFSLLKKTGYQAIIPKNISSLCCGQVFSGRGFSDAGEIAKDNLKKELYKVTNGGIIPIVVNTSSCYKTLDLLNKNNFRVYDVSSFILNHLNENLIYKKVEESVLIHEPCSLKNTSAYGNLKKITNLCTDSVFEPFGIECCGFAGDKGFFEPEVNGNALRAFQENKYSGVKRGFSQSLPCEVGLSFYTGKPYRSILKLVNECTEVKNDNS